MKFHCYRCKDECEVKQDILNDGRLAECLYRCGKCGQANFEACSHHKDDLSKKTRDRRQFWTWSDNKKEAELDLEHALAANDMNKQKKARTRLADCEKKMSLLG